MDNALSHSMQMTYFKHIDHFMRYAIAYVAEQNDLTIKSDWHYTSISDSKLLTREHYAGDAIRSICSLDMHLTADVAAAALQSLYWLADYAEGKQVTGIKKNLKNARSMAKMLSKLAKSLNDAHYAAYFASVA